MKNTVLLVDRLAKRLKVSRQFIFEAVFNEHSRSYLNKASDYKEVQFWPDEKGLKRIDHLAKALCVSRDAVICAALIEQMPKLTSDSFPVRAERAK